MTQKTVPEQIEDKIAELRAERTRELEVIEEKIEEENRALVCSCFGANHFLPSLQF